MKNFLNGTVSTQFCLKYDFCRSLEQKLGISASATFLVDKDSDFKATDEVNAPTFIKALSLFFALLGNKFN